MLITSSPLMWIYCGPEALPLDASLEYEVITHCAFERRCIKGILVHQLQELYIHGSVVRRAPRGSACLNCRRRKYKCDNVRPACGPCTKSKLASSCQYLEGPQPSRQQALEGEIARLEERIQELEQHEAASSSASAPSQSASPTPEQYSSARSTPSRMSTSSRGSAESAITASKQASRNILTPLSALPEPSAATVQILINTFFQHADQVGFFLHRGWFMRLLSARSIHPQQQAISPALLNALYLWGVRLAALDTLLLYEPVFLSRATQALAGTVAHMPSYSITHTIQAEILLANFHFASGQLAQARHHCSAATALALSCRLHQVRSIQLPRTNPIHAMEFNPPPPADVTEEAERIQAFWQVFILDACLAVPSRLPSRFVGSHGAQVDTPWPLDAEAYEQGGFPSGIRGSSTVEAFLRGTDLNPYHGSSSVALHAKAAALFERAADMASRFLTAIDTEQFAAEFVALDSVIDHFSNSLMPVNTSAGLDATRRLLVTHTLARVATIQLHQRLREMEALTESKDVSAAKAAASLLDGVSMGQVGYISPILGLLWSIVARVLHSEMTRLRSLWMSASTFGHQSSNGQQLRYMQEEHDKVAAALAKVCNAMSNLTSTSSYMAMQAEICRREMMQAGTGQ